MPMATVTTKGQITIPKDIRERLGVETGDRVNFLVQDDGTVTVEPVTRHIRELGGLLHRHKQKPVSIGNMDEGIATRMQTKFGRRR